MSFDTDRKPPAKESLEHKCNDSSASHACLCRYKSTAGSAAAMAGAKAGAAAASAAAYAAYGYNVSKGAGAPGTKGPFWLGLVWRAAEHSAR